MNLARPDHLSNSSSILPLRVTALSYAVQDKRLIDDLSFELVGGPLTIILGPNGAGKSLTLRLCHGLLRPSAGTIEWLGKRHDDVRLQQAMIFGEPVLLRRSVEDNVRYVLSVRHVPYQQRAALVEAALAQMGLLHLAKQSARVLSSGEQQRLALARVWALRPQVLFLDEPTSNLDPAATRAIEEAIVAFQQLGTKIVMTTHDLAQARRVADEILFLHKGRLLEHTPAQEFFNQPRTAEARAFLDGDLLW